MTAPSIQNGVSLSSNRRLPIKQLRNFESHFKIPTNCDSKSQKFVQRVAQQDLALLLDQFYDAFRSIYGFKRKQLKAYGPTPDGVGSIQTPKFGLEVSAHQSCSEPESAILKKEIVRLVDWNEMLSHEFKNLCGAENWSLCRQWDVTMQLDDLIDAIEESNCADLQLQYDRQITRVEISNLALPGVLVVYPQHYEFGVQKNPIKPDQLIAAFKAFKNQLEELSNNATQHLFNSMEATL